MEFTTRKIDGEIFYYINNNMVTQKAWMTLKQEQDEQNKKNKFNNDEYCPFCETVKEVLSMLANTKSNDEKFAILHSVLSECQEASYQDGYKSALQNQVEALNGLINHIDEECECTGDCENCTIECDED
jgi:hypothetical protein